MLAIHGRTVCQRYRGKADWNIIAEAKRRFPELTIFGSGDIMTAQDAVGRLRESGIDGIIVARGAIGNPWIFQEIRALYHDQPKPAEPTLQEQGTKMLEHFQMICDQRTSHRATAYFRKFCAGYCRRHPQRKKTLLAIMACKKPEEVIETITEHYEL
ncbi:MAG: tRNA-dihydrouridine synthase [Planctomycetota bacterium]|jgi:tRNA-dihydrouridine synthase